MDHINRFNMDQINILFQNLINVKFTSQNSKRNFKVSVQYRMLINNNEIFQNMREIDKNPVHFMINLNK